MLVKITQRSEYFIQLIPVWSLDYGTYLQINTRYHNTHIYFYAPALTTAVFNRSLHDIYYMCLHRHGCKPDCLVEANKHQAVILVDANLLESGIS